MIGDPKGTCSVDRSYTGGDAMGEEVVSGGSRLRLCHTRNGV